MSQEKTNFESRMMDFLLKLKDYFDSDDPILESHYEPAEKTKLLICSGSNATGKSFFGRMVSQYCRKIEEVECIRIGMELRCASGMHRAFILSGMEHEESTGVNSVHMLKGIFNTAKNRKDNHILFIDEPDIGLSESYSVAMGKYITKELSSLSDYTKLVVIVSHSRHLLQPLLVFNPAHFRLGDNLNLKEWMEHGPELKTIEDLLNLPNKSKETWRRINGKLKD
jgi:hypothetical protein